MKGLGCSFHPSLSYLTYKCTSTCRSKWSTITGCHLYSCDATWYIVNERCSFDLLYLDANVSTKSFMLLKKLFFLLFNFSELQRDESLQTHSMSHTCIFCTQSLSGHVPHRSRFTVLFTRHFPISLMCTCRQCVWNVMLICMLTTISSEITPSWLMATLLPQKPPWAMWYDSAVIRH